MQYNKYLIDFTNSDITNSIENRLDVRGVVNEILTITLSPFFSVEKNSIVYPLDEGVAVYNISLTEGFLYENEQLFYLLKV